MNISRKSGPPPIVFILLFLLISGAGYWWFFMRKPSPVSIGVGETTTLFPLPTTVASGTTVKIDGSTSMVTINKNLKNGFEKQFPGTKVETNGNGTDKGIEDI
jgi:phosphate transport system substrate-binding protein